MYFTKVFFALVATILAIEATAIPNVRQNSPQYDPPGTIRKSDGVLQASAIDRVEPSYPPLAKAARLSGSVVVEVTIDEMGNVIATCVISGHPLLKDSAVKAAKDWTFQQTKLDGVPVKVIGTITFNLNLKKYDDAIEAYKQALSADPTYGQAYKVRREIGAALLCSGRSNEAVDELKRSIELNAQYALSQWELGSGYHNLGRYAESVEALNEAMELDPGTPVFHDSLAETYLHLGRMAEAEKEYRETIKLNYELPPEGRTTNIYFSHSLVSLGEQTWNSDLVSHRI